MRKNWNIFKICEVAITIFLAINLPFYVYNNNLIVSIIPVEFAGYLVWLSLGLYLGFQICKGAYRKSLKRKLEDQKMKG